MLSSYSDGKRISGIYRNRIGTRFAPPSRHALADDISVLFSSETLDCIAYTSIRWLRAPCACAPPIVTISGIQHRNDRIYVIYVSSRVVSSSSFEWIPCHIEHICTHNGLCASRCAIANETFDKIPPNNSRIYNMTAAPWCELFGNCVTSLHRTQTIQFCWAHQLRCLYWIGERFVCVAANGHYSRTIYHSCFRCICTFSVSYVRIRANLVDLFAWTEAHIPDMGKCIDSPVL